MELSKLLQRSFRSGGPDNDCIIHLQDGQSIKAHSLVLKLHSEVFSTKLTRWSACEGGAQPTLSCTDFPPEMIKAVIDDMYFDSLKLTQTNLREYAKLSSFYLMGNFGSKCEHFLNDCLNTVDAFSLLRFASDYHLESAIENCMDVIDENAIILFNNTSSFR